PQILTLRDGAHALTVTETGFPDAVVWNPAQVKSDNMADMEAGGWQRFVCIEAAAAHEQLPLAAGAEWTGQQILALAQE
ncbi:MAG: hypothetical protein JWO94_1370, partial [Verrucomicrobiaceae bacterium]|nr:hypothetical protein [Verrucomicrobiaceae bacterium]